MKDIFKIQRPIASTEKVPQLLIYNQDRSVVYTCDARPDITKFFNDDTEMKCFVIGELVVTDKEKDEGVIVLDDRADWQDW